jgi:hypothetical protein
VDRAVQWATGAAHILASLTTLAITAPLMPKI